MHGRDLSSLHSAEILAGLEVTPKAVLFADVVDSVRLIESDEKTAVRRWLQFVDQLSADLATEQHGRLVKRMGDGLLLEFSEISDAILTAFDMQERLARLNDNVAHDARIEMRMGIDAGDVLRDSGRDLYGRHVNIAARLAAAAEPGQILASAEVRDALASDLDAEFEDLGGLFLKNISQQVRAFLVHRRGVAPRILPLLRAQDLLPTVAVIPFTAYRSDRENRALGEAMAEDLIVALSRSAQMNVISRLSTTGFRARERSLDVIGAALKADFVVSGLYLGDNDAVTLDIELAEVRTRRVVWSQRLSDSVASILQRDTGLSDLARQIHQAMLKTEMERALTNPMPTLEGYALLMASVALMHRLSARDFTLAERLLETLIDRTPNTPIRWPGSRAGMC